MNKTIGRLLQDAGYTWRGSNICLEDGVTTTKRLFRAPLVEKNYKVLGWLHTKKETKYHNDTGREMEAEKTRIYITDLEHAEKIDKLVVDGGFDITVVLHTQE